MSYPLTNTNKVPIIHPATKKELFETNKGLVDENGELIFPFVNGAYRIANEDNYTNNFGVEWNTFQKTQIDKFSGSDVSKVRFFAQTKWTDDLTGQNILEVGSGAGRFSQIILDYTNAFLYSVDYSNAVEANFKNNGPHNRLKLFQASIYELPFPDASFDKVLCLGVLQHTPDFKESVKSLIDKVKPGGEIVVDFYPINGWYTKLSAKYLLRPITKKMSHNKLMQLIKSNVGWLIKIFEFNKKIGLGFLNRFVPVCGMDYKVLGLSDEQFKEWVVLDTFDMFSPHYDNPQRLNTVATWFKEYGLKDVEAEIVEYKKGFVAATVRGAKNI